MGYKDFFELNHGWATRYYWLTTVSGADKRKEKIEDLIKKGNALFAIKTGTTPGDIVGSTWALNFFSERFVHFLKQNGIKLRTYQIIFQKGLLIPLKYYYVESIKSIPSIVKKGKVKYAIDSKCDKFIISGKGLYFDIKKWDGSDFFNIKNSNITVVTKRLKEHLEKARFKNLQFTNVEDYSF